MFDALFSYIFGNSIISIGVFAMLSFYFILVIWVFIYRYFYLKDWISKEQDSLKSLFRTSTISDDSIFTKCVRRDDKNVSKELLETCMNASIKEATVGLTILSVVAGTAPFLGLFGTVVGILETFSTFANETKVTLNVIAPAISEALVATAIGIFVAIPAYSFQLMLKRKAYELSIYLQNQIDIILTLNKDR